VRIERKFPDACNRAVALDVITKSDRNGSVRRQSVTLGALFEGHVDCWPARMRSTTILSRVAHSMTLAVATGAAAGCGSSDIYATMRASADASADSEVGSDGDASGDAGASSDAAGRTSSADASADPGRYCAAALARDARCLPNEVCNTDQICAITAKWTNAAMIDAFIACEDAKTACADFDACQLDAAKATPLRASQQALVHAYCASCRPGDAAACEATPFAGGSTTLTGVLLFGDAILDEGLATCFAEAEADADASADASADADGGVDRCDGRIGACLGAIARAKSDARIVCTASN
jgi:hypothetical protein